MSAPSKPKKPRTKPPKGRPVSTAAVSQPAVQDASSATTKLSVFSPRGDLFALLSLSADKHRLRVYNTVVPSRAVAEHLIEGARATALRWVQLDLDSADHAAPSEEVDDAPSSKKKRKKRTSQAADAMNVDSPAASTKQLVALGLSDGTVSLFSPSHARVLRTLSHASSTTPVLAIVASASDANNIWTSSGDRILRLWDARKNVLLGSWRTDDRSPYTALEVRPQQSRPATESDPSMELLAANHSIRLLDIPTPDPTTAGQIQGTPRTAASLTGHASSVTQLACSTSSVLSTAESDRFVSVWQLPEVESGTSTEGKLLASIPLDSDARRFALSPSDPSTLLAISASGKLSFYPLPADFSSAGSKKSKIPTLSPRATITVSTKNASSVEVVDACFVPENAGTVKVARLVGGVRPLFDVVSFLDKSGQFIPEVNITSDDSGAGLVAPGDVPGAAPTKRYAEPSSLSVRSGQLELGTDPSADDLALRDIDGALDVDLAELSLGQRLAAANPGDARGSASSSDAEDDGDDASAGSETHVDDASALRAPSKKRRRNRGAAAPADAELAPAASLTRTLIQALHSSDARLLEACLAHSDGALVRNTVRRLPPQLAVPLLNACMERLGRGARAANMKGGGGGASSQRGAGLVGWIKAVLAMHSGHLMTMPDLVARLSALHATLTARLTLQESMLSLSGRLDMVLSQIEMRASSAPGPVVVPKGGNKARAAGQKLPIGKYVEGESGSDEDEEDEDGMDVAVESGDDAGSVEDVELGGDESVEDSGEDEEDDDDDDDDDGDEEDGLSGGFIDDEAEEFDEESDEDSE